MLKECSQVVYNLLKTHHYSNKQLIVYGKVDHNILVTKNEIVWNQYVGIKIYTNLDIVQKEHEI